MTTQTRGHKFPILITQLSQLLMIPFGVTEDRAFVRVKDGQMHVNFGPMFDETISLKNVESAEVARWPRWAGHGPRTNFRGVVGLIGAYGNVVRLTLKKPVNVRLFLVPTTCRTLYISLEDPERFLRELPKAPARRTRVARAA